MGHQPADSTADQVSVDTIADSQGKQGELASQATPTAPMEEGVREYTDRTNPVQHQPPLNGREVSERLADTSNGDNVQAQQPSFADSLEGATGMGLGWQLQKGDQSASSSPENPGHGSSRERPRGSARATMETLSAQEASQRASAHDPNEKASEHADTHNPAAEPGQNPMDLHVTPTHVNNITITTCNHNNNHQPPASNPMPNQQGIPTIPPDHDVSSHTTHPHNNGYNPAHQVSDQRNGHIPRMKNPSDGRVSGARPPSSHDPNTANTDALPHGYNVHPASDHPRVITNASRDPDDGHNKKVEVATGATDPTKHYRLLR